MLPEPEAPGATKHRSTGALVEITPVGIAKSKHVLPKTPLDLCDQTNATTVVSWSGREMELLVLGTSKERNGTIKPRALAR